jgi:glycogen debranching enzyme
MIAARKAINDIHVEMGQSGFEELYVDQVTPDIIFVTRHNPITREVCVARFRSHVFRGKEGVLK